MPSSGNNKASEPLARWAARTIETHNMLAEGDAVLVGVSGGPDSMALLHVLRQLAPRYSLKLGVAHLDHGLRPGDSEKDAQFVSSLSRTLDLPFYLKKADVREHKRETKQSLEEAARQVRYAFFDDLAEEKGYTKIATGHTADDNAESILMNLLRGSGMTGLSGIPPRRGEKIVRPLIEAYRADVLTFLSKRKIAFVTDASNSDLRFVRNRVRHQLMPELRSSYNPIISETLNRLGAISRKDEAWLAGLVEKTAAEAVTAGKGGTPTLSLPARGAWPDGLKQRVIRRMIKGVKGDLRRISFDHIEAVRHLMESGSSGKRLHLPDRVLVERDGERVRFSKKAQPLRMEKPTDDDDGGFEYSVLASGFRPETLLIRETGARIRFTRLERAFAADLARGGQSMAFFDMDQIAFPVVVRSFRPGDRFIPLGMTGTQKVKRYFINNKIPPPDRKKCPILLSRGKIIWLAGFRQDDGFKVTPDTRAILKAELS